MNRLNGSNGDVSFSVAGLPAGMSAAFNPNPVPGHEHAHDPHAHRRRGRRPLRPVHADHGHGHAHPRSGREPALDHQAGPHPRELRPHRALRLRRRPQRELHGQAVRPLRGHERRGPDQRPGRRARRRLAPDPGDRPDATRRSRASELDEAVAGVGGQQPGDPDLRRPDRLEVQRRRGTGRARWSASTSAASRSSRACP